MNENMDWYFERMLRFTGCLIAFFVHGGFGHDNKSFVADGSDWSQ